MVRGHVREMRGIERMDEDWPEDMDSNHDMQI
jgi:hypothetical protein